ncbi:MAG: hypothetical protein ABR961_09665 [Thermoanaerobaculaceae bacterium]
MKCIARSASVVLVLLVLAHRAAAEDPMSLADSEVTNRLQYIQSSLDGGQEAANLWWYGWGVGYGSLTVEQFVANCRADTKKERQDTLVGYVTSSFGVIGQLVAPVEAGRLAAQLRAMAGDTPEARQAKLAAAESFLRQSAAQEAFGRSWRMHAITGAVNLGIGLFLSLRYDRPGRDGLAIFAIGELVSEVQIFTQPMKAVRDLLEYEHRSDFNHATAGGADHSTWYVSATPGGFVVGCRF